MEGRIVFCSECGTKANGKFCSGCGHRLEGAGEIPPVDWESSLEHSVVIAVPEVAEQIKLAESRASKKLQGDALLDLVDKLAAPFTHGLTTRLSARIFKPIGSAMGLRTKKSQCESFNLPPGRALARVLIALAEHGHKLTNVEQRPDACELTADIPADLCSVDGTLKVVVTKIDRGISLSVDASVEGQWYDWGKCNRRIGQLMQSVRAAA